jgi:hypothetical protein
VLRPWAGTVHAAPVQTTISCPGLNLPLGYNWYSGPGTGGASKWTACSGHQLMLNYQSDNNFVLYCNGSAIWATHTNIVRPGSGLAAAHTQFLYNGNLVVFYYRTAKPGSPLSDWASGTGGKGATHFRLQGDANLVIYTASGKALWSSHTAGRC